MSQETTNTPMTVRTSKSAVDAIDTLAGVMKRSRNYVVNEAIQQYLDANAWQVARIKEGLADVRAGRTRPAKEVFSEIAAKHGWKV